MLELGRVRRPEPRVCLLPTAGGDSEEQIFRFYAAFSDEACEPTHLSLFRLGRRPVSLAAHLLAQDVIYVGGGSMLNMLAVWRAHDLDRVMEEAWTRGIVLAGLSAGSMCWFEHGISTSSGLPGLAAGLGLLPGSNSVHYDGEPHRRPRYLEAVRTRRGARRLRGGRRRRPALRRARGWPTSSPPGPAPEPAGSSARRTEAFARPRSCPAACRRPSAPRCPWR